MAELIEVLEKAKAAGMAAAQAVWVRDEMQDRGSCGGAMMELDARTKLAKAAVEAGLAFPSGKQVYVQAQIPPGVRSQNADIPEASMRAMKNEFEAAGFGRAIKRFWTYVD